MTLDVRHSPEYISFLLVRLCHTYDQTMHILQEFVPLKPAGKGDEEGEREREGIKTSSQKSHFMALKEKVQPSTIQNINCDKQTSSHGGIAAYRKNITGAGWQPIGWQLC